MPKPGMHTGNETDSELNFAMSAKALPLFNAVKKFIAEEVEPMAAKFYALGENREDRWQYVPGQLELLEGVKSKAKAQGLWNFFLPNAETGEGLSNLDYAYIAVELGKSPLASECLNCSAPDTGNMEVLDMFGSEAQKEQWLKPLLAGTIRSGFAMTEPDVASSDATNIECDIRRDGNDYSEQYPKLIDSHFYAGAASPKPLYFEQLDLSQYAADFYRNIQLGYFIAIGVILFVYFPFGKTT